MRTLPPQAEKKFQGIIFDVYQWKQKMFDGTTETYELLKRPDTVVVIATVNNKIIIQKQRQANRPKSTFTSLPGGRLDKGEIPLQGAKREFLEETGYVARKWKLWRKIQPYGKMIWTVHTFIARDCQKIQSQTLDPGEKIQLSLIPFEKFLRLSEDSTFYEKELAAYLYFLRLHPKERARFKKLLFHK